MMVSSGVRRKSEKQNNQTARHTEDDELLYSVDERHVRIGVG